MTPQLSIERLLALVAISAVVACLLVELGKKLAVRLDFVHRPRGDRWSARVVPMGGGVSIVLVTALVALAALGGRGKGLALGVLAMGAIGLYDDLKSLGAKPKALAQLVVVAALVSRGYRFEFTTPAVSYAVSVFWFFGLCNAVNLLDNMDGISSGVAATMLAAISLTTFATGGRDLEACFAAAACGAALGFLAHNFKPASVFMGDAGSLALGLLVAACATGIHVPAPHFRGAALWPSAMIAAVPIFDTTLVCISRLRARRSIAVGGRDHLTHRLVRLGLSERATAVLLYLASALCATAAWLALSAHPTQLFATTVGFALVGLALLLRLLPMKVYEAGAAKEAEPEAERKAA